jgi:hypothetical protein
MEESMEELLKKTTSKLLYQPLSLGKLGVK